MGEKDVCDQTTNKTIDEDMPASNLEPSENITSEEEV